MNQHTFEQTVLAYLDGSLGRREEHAFLDEVRRDPERRAVLEQYQKLHGILEKQRSSYLPLRAERALAERIPALRSVPPLQDAAIVRASGSLRSLLSIRRVTVIILSGAALFVLLGILQQTGLAPDVSPNSTENSAPLSRTEVSETDGKVSAALGGTGGAWEASTIELETMDMKAAMGESQAPSSFQGISSQHGKRGGSAAAAPSGRVRQKMQGTGTTTPGDGLTDNTGMYATSAAIHTGDRGTAARGIAYFPVRDWGKGITPAGPIHAASEVLGRKLQAYVESGAAMRETRRGDQPIGDGYGVQNLLGLRWEFDPFLAAGVEFGQSVLAREGQRAQTSSMEGSPEMDVIIVENFLEEAGRSWLRAHLFYTLNPADLIQFQATAGTGVLLGSDRNIIISFGVAVQYPFRNNVYIRAGLHYSGTWLDASGISPILPSGGGNPIAYKYPSEDPARLYNSSIQFRIGAGYLLW